MPRRVPHEFRMTNRPRAPFYKCHWLPFACNDLLYCGLWFLLAGVDEKTLLET